MSSINAPPNWRIWGLSFVVNRWRFLSNAAAASTASATAQNSKRVLRTLPLQNTMTIYTMGKPVKKRICWKMNIHLMKLGYCKCRLKSIGQPWVRKIQFSWLLGHCHLAVKLWTKRLTYLYKRMVVFSNEQNSYDFVDQIFVQIWIHSIYMRMVSISNERNSHDIVEQIFLNIWIYNIYRTVPTSNILYSYVLSWRLLISYCSE